MKKKLIEVTVNGKHYLIYANHAHPEELVPAFQIENTTIYLWKGSYWEKIGHFRENSQLYSLMHFPADCYDEGTDDEVIQNLEKAVSNEMVCGEDFYWKVAEPRYYIPSHPHLRMIEEAHSITHVEWIKKCGFREYNAYEYEKAEQVARMVRHLILQVSAEEEDLFWNKAAYPTPRIQVLIQNYIPTVGGNPVPGKLLTQADLNKLRGLDLEFRSGADDYIYNLEDSSAFCSPFEEFCKIVLGDLPKDSYTDREVAVMKHLEMSGDVYAKTDDEIDEESVDRIVGVIRTCDVREIHYAAAQILGLNEEMSFQMPKTPEESEEEIPFDTVREAVKDYLEFSHLTSKVWAFNLTFEQITRQYIDLIAAVAGCCDTEVIFQAADCVLGTNPDLLSDPATTDAEEDEDEADFDDYGKAMIFTSPRGKKICFETWGSTTDDEGNKFFWVGMCPRCHNKHRSILGNRASKDGSGSCYVKGCENEADYYVDFSAEDVTFVTDFETVPGCFEYGGYHFVPVGTFKNKDFHEIVKKLRIDPELGVCTEGYTYPCKVPYSHESFYDASSVKTADVFRCLENGKNYTACQNDLQLFEGEYLPLGLEWD